MYKEILLLLLLGHVIGDYLFQTQKIADKKKNSWFYLLLHCAIYALSVVLCILPIKGEGLWQVALIIGGSHLLIDIAKVKLFKKRNEKYKYVIDQVIHIAIILVTYYYVIYTNGSNIQIREGFIHFFELVNIDYKMALRFVLLLILNAKPCNIFIKMMMEKPEVKDETGDSDKKKGIGAWIGTLERWIIMLFMMIEQYSSVGLVLTAKSIARYNRISTDPEFAEYYLLGTLTSTIFAVFTSIIIR